MRRLLLLNALFLICFEVYPQEGMQSLCDKLAAQYMKDNNGAFVIGIYNNGFQQIFYYGETEKGNSLKPDSNSIFELGNITETFTSILYADQVVKGKIKEDDKLTNLLPVNVTAPVYQKMVCEPLRTENEIQYDNGSGDNLQIKFTPFLCKPDSSNEPQPILLCYLSTHTSGLPDKPFNFHNKLKGDPYAEYSTDDLYEFLRGYHLLEPIGFDYRHSDIGTAVLGKALSLKLGKDYESLLVENIFDIAKMNDTRIKLSDEQNKRFVFGYTSKGNQALKWTCDAYAPVIGLHSTPSDMMKFLSLNISIHKTSLTNLLDFTHNTRIKSGKLLEPGLEIGLGWKITPTTDQQSRIVWQSGLTGGYASYIGFIETSHVGVFILSSTSKTVNDIGSMILQSFEIKNPKE